MWSYEMVLIYISTVASQQGQILNPDETNRLECIFIYF